MFVVINRVHAFESNMAEGVHVKSPTFIQFMMAMSKAVAAQEDTLYVYDDVGQFATMVDWALKEKVKELTGHDVEISRIC
jgi:hypothetical protein